MQENWDTAAEEEVAREFGNCGGIDALSDEELLPAESAGAELETVTPKTAKEETPGQRPAPDASAKQTGPETVTPKTAKEETPGAAAGAGC